MKDSQKRKYLIYGTGKRTAEVIKRHGKNNFLGILDRVEVCGSILNIPIIEWSEVKKSAAESIIIVAPQNALEEIYFRIKPYCLMRNIKIVDIYGNNLDGVFNRNEIDDTTSRDDLYKLIDDNEVISFDVYDTLLMRSTISPLDVFRMMESKGAPNGFHKIRRHVEVACRDADIFTIYKGLAEYYSWGDNDTCKILTLELICEFLLMRARDEIVELYRYALFKGKKVIITSDMYLPKVIMSEVLKIFGIDRMEEIFVSCDYGTSKENHLFEVVKNRYKNYKILHIGDNKTADVDGANRYHICAARIHSGEELLRKTPLVKLLGDAFTLDDSLSVGRLIGELFNSPFVDLSVLNSKSE